MTDFAKWDRIAATISDDEEEPARQPAPRAREAAPAPVGVGSSLTEDGRVAAQCSRPGNARGNALGANAPPPAEWALAGHSWEDEGAVVSVRVPLLGASGGKGPPSRLVADSVSATFAASSLDLRVLDEAGRLHRLRLSNLPCGGIVPEDCHHRVTAGEPPHVTLTLTKRRPSERWTALAAPAAAPARRKLSVTSYRWSDGKNSVAIWVNIPGVHLCPPSSVCVRFRELSFDLLVSDCGADHCFAVTELPMEVVVAECGYAIETDAVKIVLRKWAKTGWHALQVHR